MNKSETIKLAAGTMVWCNVEGSRGWYRLVAVRPRDGYIKIEGYGPWCPPFNFSLEGPR